MAAFAWLSDLIRTIYRVFLWGIVVLPWESGLRIRSMPFRKQRTRILKPGLRFRIPYVDKVFKQSTRLRFTSLRMQRLTTIDGKTLTTAGVLGYSIRDIELLYDQLHQAEDSLRSTAAAAIADYVHARKAVELTPKGIAADVIKEIKLERFGLKAEVVSLTNYAFVKVYSLIQDRHEDIYEDALNTNKEEEAKRPV